MKRILALLLSFSMLLPTCAFAEGSGLILEDGAPFQKPFSLFPREGVYFGMYKDEVEKAEAQNGTERKSNGSYMVSLYTYDDVNLRYYFDYDWITGPSGSIPGTLREAVFYFPSTVESYYIVEQQLLRDYGPPHYTSDSEEQYHQVHKEPALGNSAMPTSNLQYMEPFSQRLFLQPDGKYILIDHFLNNDPNPKLNDHKLIFFRLTPDEAAIVMHGRNYTILTVEGFAE